MARDVARSKRPERLTKAIKERFVKGLLVRKEAAPMSNGRLPSGATHESVDDDGDLPRVRRRRFSLT
jgi:hypothetical protein